MAGLLGRQSWLLLRRSRRQLSVLIDHDGVVEIVVFELVAERVMLAGRRSLRLRQPLGLG